jgi:hypothetical protein
MSAVLMPDQSEAERLEFCARECVRLADLDGMPPGDREEFLQVAADFMKAAMAARSQQSAKAI